MRGINCPSWTRNSSITDQNAAIEESLKPRFTWPFWNDSKVFPNYSFVWCLLKLSTLPFKARITDALIQRLSLGHVIVQSEEFCL